MLAERGVDISYETVRGWFLKFGLGIASNLRCMFPRPSEHWHFDDEVLEWVREALHASHADERREHEDAVNRLRTEYERLQARIDAMYIDKLDGKIGGEFYDRMAGQW